MSMSPMAVPKQYVFVALGAVGAFGYLYLRNRMSGPESQEDEKPGSKSTRPSPSSAKKAEDAKGNAPKDDLPGGQRELREFLAGESWYDEMGWHSVWDRSGIDSPEEWLRSDGVSMLKAEREKLADHPALLAGCRRRWIVVCRYAGIDVADAAQLWNDTDS